MKERGGDMKIPVSADLLDGLVLALLNQQDNYGYAITQAMQAAIQNQPYTQFYEDWKRMV